jgi:alpha-tubulin suppressor-like RCC1 family protein
VAKDSVGTVITPSLEWTTRNRAVASVSNGLVSGWTHGTTVVRVTAGSLSDSISLTVTEGIRFVLLKAGADHTCGLQASGAVYCWGRNSDLQLGVETTTHDCPTGFDQETAPCSPRPVRAAGSVQFTAVSAGGSHTCGLDAAGKAHCWGANYFEQLGLPWDVTLKSSTPTQVSGDRVFQTLEAGGDFNCGLSDGAAYCWGSHGFGELGTGNLELFSSPIPVPVTGGHQFIQLVAGAMHACGLTGNGEAYCWGENEIGSLGIGQATPPGEWPAEPTPTILAGGLTLAQVYAGTRYGCGLTAAGAAHCWGSGLRGRLGSGSTDDRMAPYPVAGGLTWRSLSLGLEHACGFTTAGDEACWGNNMVGELGVAPTGEQCSSGTGEPPLDCSTRPVSRPPTPRRFKSVVAGGVHTCALDDLGYAFCWGANAVAQLGNGRVGGTSHVPSPVISPQ